jgi:hypothetical protein
LTAPKINPTPNVNRSISSWLEALEPGPLFDRESVCPTLHFAPVLACAITGPIWVALHSKSLLLFARENALGTGIGLYKVKDGACTSISTYSAEGKSKSGSGFMLTAASSIDTNATAVMPNGNLMSLLSSFTVGHALMMWDLSTGARTLVSMKASTIAKSKGQGEWTVGSQGMAVNAEGIFTVTSKQFSPVHIDAKTGNRSGVNVAKGPIEFADSTTQKIWAIPGSSLLAVAVENALFFFNPKNGQSNILSY